MMAAASIGVTPLKTYILMALAGPIACAIAGDFVEMKQQISPD
jgi:hypothetical protein